MALRLHIGKQKADRQKADRTTRGAKAGQVTASGLRGLSTGIVGTLFANEVRASAGKAGLAGVAAGLAFNVMLKRTPVGAVLFGSALIAHRAYKAGKDAQAKRDAQRALAKGALAAPEERPAIRPAAA